MDLNEIPARRAGAQELLTREIASDTFVMDVERSELHDLNAVGGRIWELIDGRRSVAVIVDALTAEFEVDRARAESEVSAYLDILREKGLIA